MSEVISAHEVREGDRLRLTFEHGGAEHIITGTVDESNRVADFIVTTFPVSHGKIERLGPDLSNATIIKLEYDYTLYPDFYVLNKGRWVYVGLGGLSATFRTAAEILSYNAKITIVSESQW